MQQVSRAGAAPAGTTERRRDWRTALLLVTSLFFMWGLSYGLLDVLNKHFQDVLHVSKAESGLLQGAYFGAYFVMAIPAALLMERFGYKRGILLGLTLYAIGALLFIPASAAASFPFFLFALFVIAAGLGCLETAANPYVTELGAPETAERRLNLSQSFNGLGSFLGPLIGGAFFFQAASPGEGAEAGLGSVRVTYVVIAVVVVLLALLIARTPMPDIRQAASPAQRAAGASLWSRPHFVGGIAAQFFYVAAQVGVGAFFINYAIVHWPALSAQRASFLLSVALLLFMAGRFVSTALMGRISPAALLSVYALANVALSAVVLAGIPVVSVLALIAMFFFMSIMFPTIFALGVKDLGPQTKRGASYQVMSVVGGAIMPYAMGRVADGAGVGAAYLLPLVCFAIVAWYGWRGSRVAGA
ncbi:L-fucose:H+ symporter permease [Burkholderia glumae]|uniref:L-fucose:H+ symporter permease n=1 Tax=Burkholderia glumae TaxID=337 RepID=UPI00039BB5D4|nr:L-fucose:H+ symporter permease [Burkholderia glumae]MCM2493216.1 L-fucose:H+ symporter permease [Burkholderia glumae]MCM2544101.1 L-fucose:H+ symporter permease [Burkholderia glumae]PJO25059.1 L-fucose:H+ symporter permease [Burkholderia glumae AU6208]QHE09110.1 L-fucose:H+ symporter permease [Burkholderia glumae AU6208]